MVILITGIFFYYNKKRFYIGYIQRHPLQGPQPAGTSTQIHEKTYTHLLISIVITARNPMTGMFI